MKNTIDNINHLKLINLNQSPNINKKKTDSDVGYYFLLRFIHTHIIMCMSKW